MASIDEFKRALSETQALLQEVLGLKQQLEQSSINFTIDTAGLERMRQELEALEQAAAQGGIDLSLTAQSNATISQLQTINSQLNQTREILKNVAASPLEIEIPGMDEFPFSDPRISSAIAGFAERLTTAKETLIGLRDSGQATGDTIDNLIARLEAGQQSLQEIQERGYAAGAAFRELAKLAGSLANTRASAQDALGTTLKNIPGASALPQLFKTKLVVDDTEISRTYRQVFKMLNSQQRELSGGDYLGPVSSKTTEELAKMQQIVAEISATFPAASRPAAELAGVLDKISAASVLSTQHAKELLAAIDKVAVAFNNIAKNPITSAAQTSMQNAFIGLSLGAQNIFGSAGIASGPIGAGGSATGPQAGISPDVQVTWRYIGDYREALQMLAQSGIDLNAVTQDIATQIADMAEKAGMAGAEIKILNGEINALDHSLAVTYSATSEAFGQPSVFKAKQYFTATGGAATPIFEEGAYQASVIDRLEPQRIQAGKMADAIRDMYRQIDAEIKKLAASAQQELGPNVFIKDVRPEINETTGAIEIVVSAIRQLSDNLTEPTEKVYRLKAALDELNGTATLTPAAEQTREQSILGLFKTPQAQAAAQQNLQDLLKGTGFSMERDAQALYDYNAELVKVSLSKRNLKGVSEQLTVTLDKNGNVVDDLRTRYNGFYQAIGNNINRLFRWAVAANLVYGVMNKLQELPNFLGNLDAVTARITALTNIQRESVATFFNDLMTLSTQYAISIPESMAASEKVLQFTGGNAAVAMELLKDSMVYSKVAAVDMATATDTLTAALSQLGLKLNQGDVLLNKWVALAKQYGVSVNDLARAFGAAGSTAMEILSTDTNTAIDEFNALITVTSRVTTLSSDQLSNFIRTVMTNVTSPSSIDTLRKYGIEVEALGGGYRDFYEILRDVYYYTTMFAATSPKALADISRALGGGGARQASRMQALIESFGLVEQAKESSETAVTDLDQIMQTLTDNLGDDMKRLSNSFTELLRTMGTEGALDLIINVVESLNGLVEIFSSVTKATDNAILKMVLLIPQFQALNKVVSGLNVTNIKDFFTTLQGGGITGMFKTAFTGDAAWSNAGLTIGMGLISGINTALMGGSSVQSIATGFASAIGAALGLAFGGPTGAFIGSQITGLIANAVAKGFEEGARLAKFKEAAGGVVTPEALSDEFISEIFKQERPQTKADLARIALKLTETRGVPVTTLVNELPFTSANVGGGFNITAARNAKEVYARLLAYQQEQQAMEIAALQATIPQGGTGTSALSAQRQAAMRAMFIDSREIEYEQKLSAVRKRSLMELLDNTISLQEYKKILEELPVAGDTAALAMDIFSDSIAQTGDTFDNVLDVVATGNSELVDYFRELLNQAALYKSQLEMGIDVQEDFNSVVAEALDILDLLNKMQLTTRTPEVPAFTAVRDYTQEDFMKKVYPLAQKYDINKFTTYYLANEERMQQAGYASASAFVEGMIKGLDPLALVFKDKFAMLSGISSEAMNYALQTLQQDLQDQSAAFNIQRLPEVPVEKFGEIEKRNRYWLEYLAAIKGMSAQELLDKEGQQFNLVLGENNVWKSILSVNEAMNFTLQDILDTEKKQLEGVWNIPEGATFWVPLTSAFYNKKESQSYPELPPLQPRTVTPTETVIPSIPSIPKADTSKLDNFKLAYTEFMQNILDKFNIFRRSQPAFDNEMPVQAPVQRMLPDTMFGALERQQQLQLDITVPEKISLESTANITINLDGRVLTRVVQSMIGREMRKTFSKKTYTVPGGAR